MGHNKASNQAEAKEDLTKSGWKSPDRENTITRIEENQEESTLMKKRLQITPSQIHLRTLAGLKTQDIRKRVRESWVSQAIIHNQGKNF